MFNSVTLDFRFAFQADLLLAGLVSLLKAKASMCMCDAAMQIVMVAGVATLLNYTN